MKFSVLLPTRNRLDLLSYAIETVIRQDYSDWEIIISDNCSEEDIEDYVISLNDPRIKYYCTEEFIPVTENWNNALDKSKGDYVIMLGDDDGLMQGYFSTLKKTIEEYNEPDLIYTSAFQYAYPGVIPGIPDGYLHSYVSREIFRNTRKPFWLEEPDVKELVNQSLNFRMGFDYNMQFFLVSRKLIVRMEKYGLFYQSPYPDYYAANAVMLKAKNVLIVPQPLVAVGISPKSFGFYYFNDLESMGSEFLKCLPDPDMKLRLQKVILPGTDLNTAWLFSMETLINIFSKDINERVNYDRYRYLQICAVYSSVLYGKNISKTTVQRLKSRMTMLEKLVYGVPMSSLVGIALILPKRFHSLGAGLIMKFTRSVPRNLSSKTSDVIQGKFTTILDVFEKIKLTSGKY